MPEIAAAAFVAETLHASLRALAMLVSDAVVGVDAAGRVLWLNTAAERLFGLPPPDLVGESVEAVLSGEGSCTGRRRDGSGFPVQVAVVEHGTDEGRVRVMVVREVWHEEGFASPLMAPSEIAHELNNVFAVILTYASLVLKKAEVAADPAWEAVRRDVETIREAAAEGTALCDVLAAAGRPDPSTRPPGG